MVLNDTETVNAMLMDTEVYKDVFSCKWEAVHIITDMLTNRNIEQVRPATGSVINKCYEKAKTVQYSMRGKYDRGSKIEGVKRRHKEGIISTLFKGVGPR